MIKKYFRVTVFSLATMLGMLAMPLADQALASQKINCGNSSCADSGASRTKGSGQSNNLAGSGGILRTVTNVLLFLAGSIAVIMIVVGGIKYVVSNGDSNAVQSAKNTIMYSVVGLIITIVAYALVQFVLQAFN